MDTSARRVEAAPERLTWDEICARYLDEHVVLVDCDWIDGDRDGDFRTAVVLVHGPDHDEVIHRSAEVGEEYEEFVHEYTGLYVRGPWSPIILPLDS